MRSLLFITFFSIVFGLQAQTSITNVTATEFKKLIAKNDGILLDTRTVAEYNRGHIAGAKLIDLQDPNIRTTLLALPKNKTLYTYCYSGSRSNSVAAFLSQNGYTKIYNLQRGIIDWTNNGFALTTDTNTSTQSSTGTISTTEFQKIITSKELVFVDFYAPWCAPCKQMMPMIEELKKEYNGRIKIVTINSDVNKEVSKKAGVTSVPYLVLYKNGKPVYIKDKLAQKAELKKVFDSYLSK